MQHAPIAVFVYKRLWHTQKTVGSLLQNELAKESDLYIYSDAAKNEEAKEAVNAVRDWIKSIKGFRNIYIIERIKNLGLAHSIIDGVTTLVKQHGKVIVIEDDLVLSPYFLNYMNEGLNMYEQEEKVASIHGYAFPIQNMPEIYFFRGADCWGWATWQRAWNKFEPDGQKLLSALKTQKLTKEFNYNNTQPNIKMLEDQIAGKNNSWAIRWHASAFLNNMLTLNPGKSLVCNIGFDGSGEHCAKMSALEVTLNPEAVKVNWIPLENNKKVFLAQVNFFKSIREPIYRKIARKAKKIINKLKSELLYPI